MLALPIIHNFFLFQLVTATRLELGTTSATSSLASARAFRTLADVPVTSVVRDSGVSPSAVPVSVTATPTLVTRSLAPVLAAVNFPPGISVKGEFG